MSQTPTKGTNSLSRAATYQAVIIALVAAAILLIALFSLVWRRRQRMRFLAQVDRARIARDESRWAWVEMSDGRAMQVRQRTRRKEKEVEGREPVIWAVGLGNGGMDEYEDEEGRVVQELSGRQEEICEVSVDGEWGEEWNCLSAVIPEYTSPSESPKSLASTTIPSPLTRHLDLSVLIAMPSPDQIPISASSSRSSSSYDKPPHLDDYPVQHTIPPDAEYLPMLQVGYTSTRVRIGDGEAWSEITQDIDDRRKRSRALAKRRDS